MHKASEQIKGNLKKLCIYAQIVQAIQVYILNHVLKFTSLSIELSRSQFFVEMWLYDVVSLFLRYILIYDLVFFLLSFIFLFKKFCHYLL